MGSTKMINDFIVETKRYCFLCLKKILPELTEIKLEPELPRNLSSSAFHPLQCLSRYLKLEMRKVFCGDGPIPPHLLAKVQRSILKVELCEDCATINFKFSELFRKLEYLQMEATSWLKVILLKLEEGEGIQRTEEFQALAEQESLGIEKLHLVEALRAETMQNCSEKLRKSMPRVRIHKMETPIDKHQSIDINFEGNSNLEGSPSPIPDSDPNDDPDYDANYDTDHSIVASATSEPENPHLQNVPVKLEPGEKEQSEEEDIGDNDQPSQTPPISQTKKSTRSKNYVKTSTGKFKCKKCPKTFMRLSGFCTHYTCAHLNVKYNCSICNKTFNRLPDYYSHQKKRHNGEGIPILHPDAKNPQSKLRDNYTKTSTGYFKCNCSKQYKNYDGFYHHYLVEHLNIRYGCSICQQQFRGKSAYSGHRAIKHDGAGFMLKNKIDPVNVPKFPNKMIKIEADEVGKEETDDEKASTLPEGDIPQTKMVGEMSQQFIKTRTGKFKCRHCSRLVGTYGGFTQHYEMEHLKIRYSCSICDKEFKVINHYRVHRGRDHKGRGFMKTHGGPDKGTLLADEKFKKYIIVENPSQEEEGSGSEKYGCNSDTGKHRCNTCLKEFKEKNNLTEHYRNVHSQVKYKCGLCTKSYGSRGALRTHLSTSHKGISYKCEHCPRSFLRSITRDHHAKNCPGREGQATSDVPSSSFVETEGGNFKCNVCDDDFQTARSCRRHHFYQHKKRKCNYCEEEFFNAEEQRRHMDTTHLKCEHCGIKGESVLKLREHINGVHLQIREHVCDQCGSSFVRKTQLTKHIMTDHLKLAEEHVCDKCGKGFALRKGLTMHMKKVHW